MAHGLILKNVADYLCSSVSSSGHACNLKRWHEIMGHCNVNDVLKLEHIVDGMKITGKTKFDCDVCTLGKLTQFRNRDPDVRASAPLELVHTDLAGPLLQLQEMDSDTLYHLLMIILVLHVCIS